MQHFSIASELKSEAKTKTSRRDKNERKGQGNREYRPVHEKCINRELNH